MVDSWAGEAEVVEVEKVREEGKAWEGAVSPPPALWRGCSSGDGWEWGGMGGPTAGGNPPRPRQPPPTSPAGPPATQVSPPSAAVVV